MLENADTTEQKLKPCSLWRRIGVMTYDGVLLVCIVFIAWQPVPLLPEIGTPALGRAVRLGYLVAICFLFFGWFWTHGGQTLGMRAWRVKIVPIGGSLGQTVSWRMAWLRFIGSLISWGLAGLGYLWSIFHHNRLTWHDIFSRTRLIVLDKKKKSGGP